MPSAAIAVPAPRAVWIWALIPLVLLVALVAAIVRLQPAERLRPEGMPPVERLKIERATLAPDGIHLTVMNGFDTNFDSDNEVYALNTIANHFMHDPIKVQVGALVRMYLVNVTEFDLINSLHLHGMFFDVFRTGTSLTPVERTDTVMLCQGERAILETRFRYPGNFMFHAHQSEFAELGWLGQFDVKP